MICYPEPASHIRDKVKAVLLDLSSYATKKKLEHPTGIDIFDLAPKKILLLLKLKLTNRTLINWFMSQIIWMI